MRCSRDSVHSDTLETVLPCNACGIQVSADTESNLAYIIGHELGHDSELASFNLKALRLTEEYDTSIGARPFIEGSPMSKMM